MNLIVDNKMQLLFEEQQRFSHKIFWIAIVSLTALFCYALLQQYFLNIPFGKKPMTNIGLMFAILFMSLIILLFYNFRLSTKITSEAIIIKLYPFHLYSKRFEWPQLSEIIVREYNPLKEYGGWGLRGFGKKKSITLSGNWAIELVFHSGQSLLIGTKKPIEAKSALAVSKILTDKNSQVVLSN